MQSHPVSYYAIINALYQLLETTDFKKITINDICHQASISRSTFYKLFKDKYDILEQENQKICDTVDMALKEFLTMANLEDSLKQLINQIDHEKFIQLIPIEESSVNLRKNLRLVFKQNYMLYYEKELIDQKWQIDSTFALDMFCSIALTYLENSIKSKNKITIDQNTAFIKEMVNMFLILK